jgi:hypothetical protein
MLCRAEMYGAGGQVGEYGDLITNGLDLLSFLLVTPEIVRAIAPAATLLIRAVFYVAVSIMLFVAPFVQGAKTINQLISYPPDDWHFYYLSVCVAFGALGFSLMALAWIRTRIAGRKDIFFERADRLAFYASKHFLALGIVLFFISRLIAFYGSAAKVHLLPWAG